MITDSRFVFDWKPELDYGLERLHAVQPAAMWIPFGPRAHTKNGQRTCFGSLKYASGMSQDHDIPALGSDQINRIIGQWRGQSQQLQSFPKAYVEGYIAASEQCADALQRELSGMQAQLHPEGEADLKIRKSIDRLIGLCFATVMFSALVWLFSSNTTNKHSYIILIGFAAWIVLSARTRWVHGKLSTRYVFILSVGLTAIILACILSGLDFVHEIVSGFGTELAGASLVGLILAVGAKRHRRSTLAFLLLALVAVLPVLIFIERQTAVAIGIEVMGAGATALILDNSIH